MMSRRKSSVVINYAGPVCLRNLPAQGNNFFMERFVEANGHYPR